MDSCEETHHEENAPNRVRGRRLSDLKAARAVQE